MPTLQILSKENHVKRFTVIPATTLAAALFLSGCGADSGSGQAEGTMPGMDHGSMSGSPAPSGAGHDDAGHNGSGHSGADQDGSDAAGHNDADAMFAQMMIVHHQQAVEMSDIILAKDGMDPQIIELANEIKAAQGPEIEKMTAWLQGWNEPLSSGHSSMDGMVSDEGLAQLKAAQGTEAARLFLTQMIAHHEGAISMADEEKANGSNPEALELAESVVSEQGTEMQTMKNLLATL